MISFVAYYLFLSFIFFYIILGGIFLSQQCPCWLPSTKGRGCWYVQRWQHLLLKLDPPSLVPHTCALQLSDGQQLAHLQLQRGPRERIHPELHHVCNDAHPSRHSQVKLYQA